MESSSDQFSEYIDDNLPMDMMTAASTGDNNLVRAFLEQGYNPNEINSNGWSALMYASTYGFVRVVRVLVEYKADVNKKEPKCGKTALMMASGNGHTRCIELLVHMGKADILMRDDNGNNAAWYACHHGHGTNMIIARLLDIQCSSPRTPVKLSTSNNRNVPSITLATPDNSQQVKEKKPLNLNAPPFIASSFLTPTRPSTTNEKQSKQSKSPVSSRTFPRNTPNTETPVYPVSKEQSQTLLQQKRAILGGQGANSHVSVKPNLPLSPNNSPALPKNLETLLARVDLDKYMYHDLFEQNGIDLYMFLTLTDQDFVALGITPFGHRRKLMLSQIRFRESVEIRSTPETILSDYLLVQREQLLNEIDTLKAHITAIHMAKALNIHLQDSSKQ